MAKRQGKPANRRSMEIHQPRISILKVKWTAGGSSGGTVLIAGGSFDTPNRASAVFICTAAASAGTFTVPTWALANVPPTASNAISVNGAIFLALAPLNSPTTFAATGLNSGLAFYMDRKSVV